MLPLLIAGGAVAAAFLLSGCESQPSPPEQGPLTVPVPQDSNDAAPTEDSPAPSSRADATPPLASFLDALPHGDSPDNQVPSSPCGLKFHFKGMARFPSTIWAERNLKFEEVVKAGNLLPQNQDRILLSRGNCPTPVRQLLRVTQEDFQNEESGIRLASLSLLTCFQNKKCSNNDDSQRLQFAIPFTESLRELFLIDENKDGTEDLLFISDGKYSYVVYGDKVSL